MSLSWSAVREVLESFGCFRFESGAYGFTIGSGMQLGHPMPGNVSRQQMRLESGSGIAGRSGHWALVEVRSGKRTASVTTRAELRRVIREWLVDEARPPDDERWTWHAKQHATRFGKHFIWARRAVSRPSPPVPPPSAPNRRCPR